MHRDNLRILSKDADNFLSQIQYMVAVPLIFGRLTTEDYTDAVAADPRIDALREKVGSGLMAFSPTQTLK